MADIGIDENDKQFLTNLGRGVDISVTTNFDQWMEATSLHVGKTVREVKDNHSNVQARTRGKEAFEKKIDATEDKSRGLSANLHVSTPNTPAGGSVNVGGSRSDTLNSVQYEKLYVIRMLEFKDDTPSFPTKLEKDMYKFVIEQLNKDQSASHSSSATIEADINVEADDTVYVKKFNEYKTSQLEDGKWDDIANIISKYICTTKVTHYVSSIALGVKETEIKKGDKNRTEFDAGAKVEAPSIVDGGLEAKLRSEQGSNTVEKKSFGERVCADGGEENSNQAIVQVGINPISELVKDSDVKTILDKVTSEYHKQTEQRRANLENSGLIGPVQIRCDDGLAKVYWCVDDGAGIIKGTSDKKKSSEFYLKDKGKGIIYIIYFKENEITGANKRRLAVRGTEVPSTQIIAAKVSHQYDDEPRNLEFEMVIRDVVDEGKMTVTNWMNRKDSIYLCVRSAMRYMPRWIYSPKFYIKMNTVQGTEYDVSFISKDDSNIDLSDDTFLFLCESTMKASIMDRGKLLGTENASSSRSRTVVAESTSSSYIADSAPPSESRTQSDSSSAEISDNPQFSKLVSEDYIFPDLDIYCE